MNKLDLNGQWLLGQLFYYRDTGDLNFDESGEKIIRELIPILYLTVNAILPDTYFTWLRYSLEGFHLRLQIWIPDGIDHQPLKEKLIIEVTQYKLKNKKLFEGEMSLTPISKRLNALSQHEDLRKSGEFVIGMVSNTGEDDVYKSAEGFYTVQQVFNLDSFYSVKILGDVPSMPKRWGGGNVLFYVFLENLCQNEREKALIALFLKNTWLNTFSISEPSYANLKAYLDNNKKQLLTTLSSRVNRNKLLTSIVTSRGNSEDIINWVTDIEDFLKDHNIDKPSSDETSTDIYLMQVLSIIHQTYNRLGVSILNEVASAHFFYDVYAQNLSAEENDCIKKDCLKAMDYWENVNAR